MSYEDILKQISEAKTSEGGNYIRSGTYVLEVKKIIVKKNRKGIPDGIGEFIVRESIATGRDLEGKDTAPNKVGETVASVIDLTKDTGPGNFKAMLLGVLGVEDKPGDAEFAQKIQKNAGIIISDSQPARGTLVRCEAVTIRKKDGGPFTKLNWSAHPDNSDEAVQTRRAAQGGTPVAPAA